jgi:hypothetical protein
MTDLEKPVTRRTTLVLQGHRVVVTLRPDNQIEFRQERKSEKFVVPIDELYRYAQRATCGVHIPTRKR